MALTSCPHTRCRSYINVPNVADEARSACPICRRPIRLYKCYSCMKVVAFGAVRPGQCPACFTLIRSLAPLPRWAPAPLGAPAPPRMSAPTVPQPIQEIDFGEYTKTRSTDHPPNELSVVDAHLPPRPHCGVWVRNDLEVKREVGGLPNWTKPQYTTLRYTVGTWTVLVVWPKAYARTPPAPNRLGWLPQMEFGSAPGLTDPRAFPSGQRIQFRYKAMNGSMIDLDFTAP